MNDDLPSCVTVSKTLLFVDDTKIYNTVHKSEDILAFQNDLDSASLWSKRNDMCFNPQKMSTLVSILRSPLITKLLIHRL